MSVLVEGMDMPVNCDECRFYFFGWYKSHEKGADEDFRFAETCLAAYRRGLTGIRTDNQYTVPKGMRCPLVEFPEPPKEEA